MRSVRTARLALGAACAAFALYLALGEHPWEVPGGPGFFVRKERLLVHTVEIALWWSCAAGALIAAALFATAGFWASPVGPRRPAGPGARLAPLRPEPGTRRARSFLPLLLVAAALGAALRLPLARGGLWWDEAWVVQHAVVGDFEPEPSAEAPDAELRFDRARWIETLFEYEKPTTHLAQSVAARLSVDAWRRLAGAEPWTFDELALRLPGYLASLLAIALLGLLVADWGFPRAGAAAAFLLALHPWHVQHGPEAHGYSLVVLFAVAGALALGRTLSGGGLGAWLAYAATQALLFWTHAFGAYLTAALSGAALVWLLAARRAREAARLVAANAMAGVAVLLVMGPALAQVPLWHAKHEEPVAGPAHALSLAGRAARELWVDLATGLPRRLPDAPAPHAYPSFGTLAGGSAMVRPAVFVALPALALAGLAVALRRRGPHRPVVVGLALAPPLAIAASAALGHLGERFHARFMIYALAAVVPAWTIGAEALAARAARLLASRARGLSPRARARGMRERAAAAGAVALGAALFAWLAAPQLGVLLRHPYSGMRDAVSFVEAQPDAERAFAAGLGLGGETVRVYAPRLVPLLSARELRTLCNRAAADGRPLYLLYGYDDQNRARLAEPFAWLDDPHHFERLAFFPGILPQFGYHVLRYTGAALPAEGRPDPPVPGE